MVGMELRQRDSSIIAQSSEVQPQQHRSRRERGGNVMLTSSSYRYIIITIITESEV